MVKNVDGPAVRLVDDTDAALAAMPGELAVTLVDIAAACREGLMAVAVEAGLATAMAIMGDEAAGLCGVWNARDPERTYVRGGATASSVVMGAPSCHLMPSRIVKVSVRPSSVTSTGTVQAGLIARKASPSCSPRARSTGTVACATPFSASRMRARRGLGAVLQS